MVASTPHSSPPVLLQAARGSRQSSDTTALADVNMGPQKSAEVNRVTEEGDMLTGDVASDLIIASGEKKVAVVGGGLVSVAWM